MTFGENVASARPDANTHRTAGQVQLETLADDPPSDIGEDRQPASDRSSSADRFLLELSRTCGLLLAVLFGAWLTWKDMWPYEPYLRNAFLAFEAVWESHVLPHDPMNTDVWRRVGSPDQAEGVTAFVPGKAFDGDTLVAFGESAALIDMNGTVLHKWHFPVQELEAAGVAIEGSFPDTWTYWKPARVLPNGDLIAIVDRMHATPEGVALIKLDRQSNLVWLYDHAVHHDFDIDRKGNIYVLDQALRQTALPDLPALVPPLIDEGVVVLSSDGKQIARISITEAFQRSEYRKLLNEFARENRDVWGDYLHSNNIDVVDADLADAFEFLEEGQVLLSFREISTLAVLDLDEKRIVWAARGQWHRQHDPDLLPNGNIIVFDNQGDWARGGGSRVIEFDPLSREVVWQFPAHEGQTLDSFYRGGQQKLPNGNVLINDFYQNRLIEVTEDGSIVWEYRCPFAHPEHANLVCRSMSAWRYQRNELAFLNDEPTPPSSLANQDTRSYQRHIRPLVLTSIEEHAQVSPGEQD